MRAWLALVGLVSVLATGAARAEDEGSHAEMLKELRDTQAAHQQAEVAPSPEEAPTLEGYLAKGDAQRAKGDHPRALWSYLLAHRLDLEDPRPIGRIATLHLSREPERAEVIFLQLLEQGDDSALARALGRSTAWFRAFCGERRTFMSDSADQLRAARRPLAMPVVVLDGYYTMAREGEAGGYTREDAAARDAVWHRLHRELATISPTGELVIADRSSHNVHIDQPELVLSAITRVVESARGGRP